MTTTARGPKPRVSYDGRTYTCRAWSTKVPDLDSMPRPEALVWLNRNTIPTGVGLRTSRPNLAGITLQVASAPPRDLAV